MPQRGKRLLGGRGGGGRPAVPHPHKGQTKEGTVASAASRGREVRYRLSSTNSPFQRPQGPPGSLLTALPQTALEESGVWLPQREMCMCHPPGDKQMDRKASMLD